MTFSIDFLDDGRVLEWATEGTGASPTVVDDYTPRFYVGSRAADVDVDLAAL